MKTLLKRIFRNGWLSFRRNQSLSLVTVFVMFLAISLLTTIFLFRGAANFLLISLERKIDISVYFKEEVLEEEILGVKDSLSKIEGVKAVDFVSREEALARFRERHQYNDLITQALGEVGDNPFLASLNVQAADSLRYETVSKFLEGSPFDGLIASVDYFQRKPVIEKFYSLKDSLEKTGLAMALVFGFVAFAITFVTIRLAIYASREEVGIMRLVGASNWFIRGPFLVQGIICGLIAFFFSLAVFSAVSYFLTPRIFDLTGGFNLFKYFMGNLPLIIGIQLLSGAGLGVFSSLVAVGRYLDK